MQTAAREILRALRGRRSQVAFSRRLGYRSNVAADWEQGRRAPTILAVLDAADRLGADTEALFRDFHPAAFQGRPRDRVALGAWLGALAGERSTTDIAAQLGRDRQAVWRVLSGRSEPRLPEFLELLDALTGRVTEWVAGLVDIDAVPSLQQRHRRLLASRSVGLEQPWTMAVLMLLQTPSYAHGGHATSRLAADLGTDATAVERSLNALQEAGVIAWNGDRYVAGGELTLDTRGRPEQRARLRAHWTQVALDRIPSPREHDLFSYNVFAVTRDDLDRIQALQRAFYRQVRAIVAASPEPEVVTLLNLQCVGLGPQRPPASEEDSSA